MLPFFNEGARKEGAELQVLTSKWHWVILKNAKKFSEEVDIDYPHE